MLEKISLICCPCCLLLPLAAASGSFPDRFAGLLLFCHIPVGMFVDMLLRGRRVAVCQGSLLPCTVLFGRRLLLIPVLASPCVLGCMQSPLVRQVVCCVVVDGLLFVLCHEHRLDTSSFMEGA